MTDSATDSAPASADRSIRKLRRRILLGVIGIACIASVWFYRESRRRDAAARSEQARPIEVLQTGFVSSDSCVECHEEEHQTWHASYHRTMTQVISPATAPEILDGTEIQLEGVWYRFFRQGDHYFVSISNRQGDETAERRELLMITGSHHMHVFWYDSRRDRAPAMLPIMYYILEQRWIPKGATFLRPPGIQDGADIGTWNVMCSHCHSTQPRQRFDQESSQWDTHVVEFGISCEACHGGAAEHVRHQRRLNQTPGSAKALDEGDVVNPTTVSDRVASDVCGRCHAVLAPDMTQFDPVEFSRTGNPHQPGQLLSDHPFLRVVRGRPEQASGSGSSLPHGQDHSFWPDGMIRLAGREYNGLIESPCYQRGEMTCISCHTLHAQDVQSLDEWRDDQLKPKMRGDEACLQCHSEYEDKIVEHTHHPVASSGSRCMNCHMPHTTYGLLKTLRSHQVTSPRVSPTIENGERPNACALCHLDQSDKWVSNFLHQWYGQPEVELDKESSEIAASLVHFLKGDAAQRAVQAAAFGWQPAREASGTDWIEPILLIGMTDPYDAVRVISARSLRTLPQREGRPMIDAIGIPFQRDEAVRAEIELIRREKRFQPRAALLIDAEGVFDLNAAMDLYQRRNQRPVELRE